MHTFNFRNIILICCDRKCDNNKICQMSTNIMTVSFDCLICEYKLNRILYISDATLCSEISTQIHGRVVDIIGYEPAGLTVHPPQNDRGWVHFFRMGV